MQRLLLATLLIAAPLSAQSDPRPHLVIGAGIAGQRDGDRDLGSAGLTTDVGVTWRVARGLRARLATTLFLLPGGQGCACDPGSPPLAVQGAYGAFVALQTVPRVVPLYWLGGAGVRSGGFNRWNEQQTMTVLAGLGLAFGPARRAALEVRYEHFVSALGATRALLPLTVTWQW